MGPAQRVLVACALALASLSLSDLSEARRSRTKVEWTSIEVPHQSDEARLKSKLTRHLNEAVKRADFGGLRRVEASVRVVELKWDTRPDLVRLSCTVVGRLKDGPSARSRISFGDRPEHRDQLEEQVLTSVARGVVGRLAQLARTAAERAEPERS